MHAFYLNDLNLKNLKKKLYKLEYIYFCFSSNVKTQEEEETTIIFIIILEF